MIEVVTLVLYIVLVVALWELGKYAYDTFVANPYRFLCEECEFTARSNNEDTINRVKAIHLNLHAKGEIE